MYFLFLQSFLLPVRSANCFYSFFEGNNEVSFFFFRVKLNLNKRKNKGACMRCMYGFCKNDSRIPKSYREYNLFYCIRFPRLCLHYSEGHIEKKELMTHCKEFNDCLKFKNWLESCGRSHDKFNSIDSFLEALYYTLYLPYTSWVKVGIHSFILQLQF